jgi:hypothetical protein
MRGVRRNALQKESVIIPRAIYGARRAQYNNESQSLIHYYLRFEPRAAHCPLLQLQLHPNCSARTVIEFHFSPQQIATHLLSLSTYLRASACNHRMRGRKEKEASLRLIILSSRSIALPPHAASILTQHCDQLQNPNCCDWRQSKIRIFIQFKF